jgi:hypothetical protein
LHRQTRKPGVVVVVVDWLTNVKRRKTRNNQNHINPNQLNRVKQMSD